MTKLGEHAVVLGASMGGLLAAQVLADFYETVKGSATHHRLKNGLSVEIDILIIE